MKVKHILQDKTNTQKEKCTKKETQEETKEDIEIENVLPYEEELEKNAREIYREISLDIEDILNKPFFI